MATGFKADGVITIGTSVDVGGINTGLYKIQKSMKRLAKITAFAFLGKQVVKFGKDALGAASDLVEVQNVVDKAFESMSYKMEEFADIALETYGISQQAAKETGSAFMEMGKAMGFSLEDASNMALQLTALTADMSSFYNISQEYAKTAISAVYTGETETLKRYGILLTEANLQAYLNTKNIEANIKTMSAHDKAMVRYMYVMEATKDIQGDFADTSQSWANQMRILANVWQEFLIVMGSGFNSILLPVLNKLVALLKKVTQAATVLWSLLARLFNLNLQLGSTESKTSGVEDMAEALEDEADAADSAGKALKNLTGDLDELNILSESSSSSSDSMSSMFGDFAIDALDIEGVKPEELPEFNNLFEFGRWISEGIKTSLDSVDWSSVYATANKLGKGLADLFNGLNWPETFASVGKTIAGALNTVIYTSLSFAGNFDFVQLGEAISSGINSFFDTFDFNAFGASIRTWCLGIVELMKTVLSGIEWSDVFKAVKEFFSGLGVDGLMALIGLITLKHLIKAGILKAFISGISEGLGIVPFNKLFSNFGKTAGKAVSKSMDTFSKGLSTSFEKAGNSAMQALDYSIMAGEPGFKTAISAINTWGSSLRSSLVATFGAAGTVALGLVSVIGGLFLSLKGFFDMWKNGFSIIKEALMLVGIVLTTIGAIILGVAAFPAIVVGAIVAAVATIAVLIHDNWETIKSWFSGIGDWISKVGEWFSQIPEKVKTNCIEPIKTFFSDLWDKIKEFFAPAVEWFTTNVFEPISSFVSGFVTRISQFFEGLWIIIQAVWIVASTWFNETVIEPIAQRWELFKTQVEIIFTAMWLAIQTVMQTLFDWVNTHIIQPLQEKFTKLTTVVGDKFTALWTTIQVVWSIVSTWFSETVIDPVVNAWETATTKIGDFFTSLWETIASGAKNFLNGLITSIENAINGAIDTINIFLLGFNSIVEGAAKIAGKDWNGVDLIPRISIPRLAQGAVIPPNNEFMAVLGDQTSGTNIEAPLSTIQDAVALVLEPYLRQIIDNTKTLIESNQEIADKELAIGDREIARASRRGQKQLGMAIIS